MAEGWKQWIVILALPDFDEFLQPVTVFFDSKLVIHVKGMVPR